jgi:hypothetical protein
MTLAVMACNCLCEVAFVALPLGSVGCCGNLRLLLLPVVIVQGVIVSTLKVYCRHSHGGNC